MEVLFSFGTWKGFPFNRGYIIINAANKYEAIEKFRKLYPHEYSLTTLNCSGVYTDTTKIREYKANGNLGVGCHQYIDLIEKHSLEELQRLLDDRECKEN